MTHGICAEIATMTQKRIMKHHTPDRMEVDKNFVRPAYQKRD